MASDDFDWKTPVLDADDQILIEEYERLGVSLDSLAYTPEFKNLVSKIGGDPQSEPDLRKIYLRLLGLRKRGVLPRLYHGSSSSAV
jgi:hypothetical protein